MSVRLPRCRFGLPPAIQHLSGGSAANLGAVRVADLARQLEHAAGDTADPTLVDRLEAELDEARRSLREVLQA